MSEASSHEVGHTNDHASMFPRERDSGPADVIPIAEAERKKFRPRLLTDSGIDNRTIGSRLSELIKTHEIRRAGHEDDRSRAILQRLLVAVEVLPPENDSVRYPVEDLIQNAEETIRRAKDELSRGDFRQMVVELAEQLDPRADRTNLMRATQLARQSFPTFGNELIGVQRIVYLLLRDEFSR